MYHDRDVNKKLKWIAAILKNIRKEIGVSIYSKDKRSKMVRHGYDLTGLEPELCTLVMSGIDHYVIIQNNKVYGVIKEV